MGLNDLRRGNGNYVFMQAVPQRRFHRSTKKIEVPGESAMMFFSRVFQLSAVLCISWLILPAASAHGIDTVQARSPEDIVNAILSANASGKTTVIHVAPGEYAFAQSFDADGGPSLLPPITGTVLLLGKKADTTRFINSGQLARFINVRENGILQVRVSPSPAALRLWRIVRRAPTAPIPVNTAAVLR